MLRLGAGAAVGLLLAGCGGGDGDPATTVGRTAGGTTSSGVADGATADAADVRGVVFNTASKDVTLFDPRTNRVTGTKPTSAVVRWLSNEQHYYDGERVWTYDYPEGEVLAIAIDPETFEVTKRVPTGGAGPGHSLVLSPNNERGFVNCAGSNFLAVVDPVAGEVIERVEMGAYP